MLFATLELAKLRSLTRRRHYARPVASVLLFVVRQQPPVYIWADANFYRPITMQRANLPLSYPMTARRFLEKHGLLDARGLSASSGGARGAGGGIGPVSA